MSVGPDLVRAALDGSGELSRARREITVALPGDETVESHRVSMLRFVEAHADALQRSCGAGHLTSSALVVDPSGRQALLLEHRKLRRWFQPGGHADGEANLARSALREATEESGIAGLVVYAPAIDLDVHEVRPPGEAPHLHLDVRYLVLAPPGAVAVHNHESTGQAWVSRTDLPGYRPDAGLVRLVHRGLALATGLVKA
jgi:8-oxo-dGTP pyrophosphatase MutT (NUDIX family)